MLRRKAVLHANGSRLSKQCVSQAQGANPGPLFMRSQVLKKGESHCPDRYAIPEKACINALSQPGQPGAPGPDSRPGKDRPSQSALTENYPPWAHTGEKRKGNEIPSAGEAMRNITVTSPMILPPCTCLGSPARHLDLRSRQVSPRNHARNLARQQRLPANKPNSANTANPANAANSTSAG